MKGYDVKNEIVKLLSANEFLSGEELGDRLGMSRAAVSKHIKALQQAGLDVFSLQGKGYKLANRLDVLCSSTIARELSCSDSLIEVHNIVTSTNDIIKQDIRNKPNGYVCIAEAQTQGRGRRGRQWHSPFGANIYLSMVWHFDGGFQMMAGLSLAIGVSLCQTFSMLAQCKGQVKWPNDVLVGGKKLAGILIETEGYSDGSCAAIIGCGINFDMPEREVNIDQPWTDLCSATQAELDRNNVTAAIISGLRETLQVFDAEGFIAFKARWESYHAFQEQRVTLTSGDKSIMGIAKGVDNSGALAIETLSSEGQPSIKYFHGGEVSVRAV